MKQIENRMVIYPDQEFDLPMDVKERLNGPGYQEIGSGVFVLEDDAYQYALERISSDEDLKWEFVEWFYSGNWVEEE